jgi:ribose 5-phosphate isomerase RpiB
LCLGGKVIGSALALEILRTFLDVTFSKASRCRRRLEKLRMFEGSKAEILALPAKN